MSHLQYFTYPGFGERVKKEQHYSPAVKYDNIIEISGQGGWLPNIDETKISDDLGTQVDQAFANVELALQQAGGTGWDQVFKINMYTLKTDAEILEHVVRNLRKYCPNHQPLLTSVGVANLFLNMQIEIEVKAHTGS